MRLIADGVVEREGVGGLAGHLGYSTRQIERHLRAELGAGPLAIARAQRAQTARVLIETTSLPMAQTALAAGFASIRSFNDTVREIFAASPTEMRHQAVRGGRPATPGSLSLRLPFRRPLCPDNLFGHLAATAVPGVEEWRDGRYRRTLRLPHGSDQRREADRDGGRGGVREQPDQVCGQRRRGVATRGHGDQAARPDARAEDRRRRELAVAGR